ncbi:MAG TPA: LON peptidase substrate-binding domain-containing protein, partial [Candidatus Limnocylindrales bacterium]|nr:LON peptidase substrate-binding domain-containing protein [Candidatus Limnocylindrales bacterium]
MTAPPTEPQGRPAEQEGLTQESVPAQIPDVLPVLPLRQTVVFPSVVAPIAVGQARSLRLIDDAMGANRLLALVATRRPEEETPGPDDLERVGTAARILQLMRLPDGSVRLLVQGLQRIRLSDFTATEPYLIARVSEDAPRRVPDMDVEGLRRAVIDLLRRLAPLMEELPDELPIAAERLTDPIEVAYLAASVIPIGLTAQQELLELDPLDTKLRRLIELLQQELAARELGRSISEQTRERIGKANREALLREQLRSIQAELGEGAGGGEVADLRRRLEEAKLPDEARREAERELERFAAIPEASPERGMIRSWLEWMADLPWAVTSGGAIEVAKARVILDEDHYDLDEVKARILEYLAVRKLRRERAQVAERAEAEATAESASSPEAQASDESEGPAEGETGPAPTTPADEAAREPILCFVGPPGVGKTSLGRSIARALGRKFVRMSLGGVRDEAEIRGHRRTYVGAMPGRILQGIRRVGARDPVFMLDEVDKVGSDWRGDPTSALLEVLDPAQNDTFVDNYVGVAFDLSQVLFITTANTLDTIPPPLLDRMEVLRIAGYTEEEKLHIAERYLIPQQLAANGLAPDELTIDEAAIRRVIREHTREAGVRELDRRLAAICRKVARRVAESAEGATGPHERVEVRADDVPEYLGRRRFFEEAAERTERPGVATGLAWTPSGGEILYIEAAMIPDSEDAPLLLTGMLGDVMRESAM